MRETLGPSLRPVTTADAHRLWELRNEDTVRRASFSGDAIPFDRHERWLATRLADTRAPLYMVGTADGRDVGYVRFDVVDGELQLSIALAPEARGQGLGPRALREAVTALRASGRHEPVVALVRADNPRSRAAFLRAGFVPLGERRVGPLTALALGWPDD
jgi:RimJ/RimL family protein N-acetyltransferase